MKELEEKSKEALLLVQKKHVLWRYQNERDEARRLHRSGSSGLVSFVSCRSSAVANTEEMSPESQGKMQRVRLR